ncbi:MAG: class B sortase [Evtepia sp.]|uniref:class B sortase n=1 Tax=Evtepia sp. TaxID=2773933 RepID=UPI002A756FFE|nr:class B sortase [Evtepia sp.]MDY3014716.1 class B sortase [Evtepia sp.]
MKIFDLTSKLKGERSSIPRKKLALEKTYPSAILLLGVIFLISVTMIIKIYAEGRMENDAFKKLASAVAAETSTDRDTINYPSIATDSVPSAREPAMATATEGIKEVIYTRYAPLYEQNNDFVGWLSIKNTNIDYPVMHTPDDPEYYLRRAFDGSDSRGGTPFVGANSTIDSDCFIIYSHNMRTDTMFGTLDYYREKEFFQENPTFTFTTLTEQRTYEVFAALETRILYNDEAGFRYYEYSGELTQVRFEEIVDWLKNHSEYNSGITPVYGEQILILSTCSYHTENGRFLVAAQRISD